MQCLAGIRSDFGGLECFDAEVIARAMDLKNTDEWGGPAVCNQNFGW
jgi:hypothetical protein